VVAAAFRFLCDGRPGSPVWQSVATRGGVEPVDFENAWAKHMWKGACV
jgi:hypothetical protein